VSSEGETDEGPAPACPQKALKLIFHRRRGPSSDPLGATFSLEGEGIARGVGTRTSPVRLRDAVD